MTEATSEHQLVTIEYFCKTMLGLKTRYWFYKHANDPGMPERVYIGGEPRLVLSECEAYVEARKQKRPPKGPPAPKGRGRPRLTPPAAA